MPYSIVFLSSSEISNPLLSALVKNKDFEVKALICQPDRPAGRGHKLTPPKSKVYAQENKIQVFQSENLKKDQKLYEEIKAMNVDFLLTFAYGQILSQAWLDLPKMEPLNVHTSLLPKYRGASPIQAAILNGDTKTGISLMRMVKKMDEGAVFAQSIHEIGYKTNAGQLHDELSQLAGEVIPEQMLAIAKGESTALEQSHENASTCHKINKADAYTDFSEPANTLFSKFKAYSPWPGLWTQVDGKRLKIIECDASNSSGETGTLNYSGGVLTVACSEGSLVLEKLQLEGKKACSASDLLNGNPELLNSKLG